MALPTHGTMAVDWEQRIDFDRLRRERLQRHHLSAQGVSSCWAWFPITSGITTTLLQQDADNKTTRGFRQAEECVSTVLGSSWDDSVPLNSARTGTRHHPDTEDCFGCCCHL